MTKSSVRARIKELQQDSTPDDDEELVALRQCLALFDAKAQAENEVKAAQSALDERTLAHYGKLTEDDIKSLVIEDKWLAALQASINEEVARVAQRLTARVKELEERYAEPLPSIGG